MSGLLRFVQVVVVAGAVVGGGMALWHNREKVRQTWDSIGGMSAIQGDASKLTESVGPIVGIVRQLASLKK
jgi:hypothetical protein